MIRAFRLKCRQTTRLNQDGTETSVNKVVNQRDYVGLEAFIKHGVETFNRYDSISWNGQRRAELYEKRDGKWVKLTDLEIASIWPPTDKFGETISAGDLVDVQQAGVHRVWEEAGELWFAPYGKPDRVKAYFSNDIIKQQ